jgi:hypothetical protein
MNPFARGRWSVGVASALVLGGMAAYPGGTYLDGTSSGYSITRNFFSDLGMTTAWNGETNRVGAILFIAALLLLIIGLGGVVARLVHLMMPLPRSRTPARLAAIVALAVCVCFAGVAATPENSAMNLHVWFTFTAFRLFPLAAILMAIAVARSGLFSRRAVVTWAVLAVELLIYQGIMTWGPRVNTDRGLLVQVIAQKAIAVGACLALFLLTFDGDRTLRTSLPQ